MNNTWLNSPKFAGLYDDADPLVAPSSPHGGTFTVQSSSLRERVTDVPRFVSVRGGAYFFMPGLAATRSLARLGQLMDADDRLRLDYDQTSQLLRTLIDIRFRLIAFVPTFAAVAVGFFARPRPAVELLAIGALGLVATFGIYLYELQNSQLYAAAAGRARELERQLELSGGDPDTHDLGLSLVYGAALAGWSYIVSWGSLRALELESARGIGLAIGGDRRGRSSSLSGEPPPVKGLPRTRSGVPTRDDRSAGSGSPASRRSSRCDGARSRSPARSRAT